MKASCDSCSADITHNVHVRCAETQGSLQRLTCPDFDLCVPCFLTGKSVGPHRPTHAYRIISSHAFPIFTADWGADEELLLIEGAEMYGLGNWADMSEHVGGRTKEECEQHYEEIYLRGDEFPLPHIDTDFSDDQEAFSQRKKARLEELQRRPLGASPPPKPLASAPTCHEISGFMPGRLEFETEYENEAETLVKDMEFGKVYAFGGELQPSAEMVEEERRVQAGEPEPVVEEKEEEEKVPSPKKEKKDGGEEEEEEEVGVTPDEPEADLELKLSVLEMFNERYDKRMAAKEVIFDRGLMNYKTISANERKRTKEERDLITRTKVFARVQTAEDAEVFVDGLLYELALRKRIAELQEYRRMGVTTIAEGEKYDHQKSSRSTKTSYRDSILSTHTSYIPRHRPTSSLKPRPTTSALTLSTSSSLHLLTPLEQTLCSTLRILPKPYLYLKETLLREWSRSGGRMGAEEARRAHLAVPPPRRPRERDSVSEDRRREVGSNML
ncbi:hypothetical protein BCR35DRAFT_317170 [Leucosporidium creatinivorum]|uniref:Transcriptional adapter 2 n=1 Tax=Leucosporidium creatinivorum TaxID=106004 RepID=A0A1Y2G230_9BASI|nr:hypothetical protein BCR35DRAFT_317170 [Leucosporidium creatinivorum]